MRWAFWLITINIFRPYIFQNVNRNVYSEHKNGMEEKIINGQYGTVLNHPHAAYLAIYSETEESFCGASIINQYFLVTAAHCVFSLEPCCYYINVAAGTDNRNKITHLVEHFRYHENYRHGNNEYDIALLKLTKPLQFGMTLKRVIVTRYPPLEEYGYVAGWGITDVKTEAETDYLKEARQHIMPFDVCFDPRKKRMGLFCGDPVEVYDQYGRPDQGDSGSGFIVKKYILTGLVSYYHMVKPERIFYTNVSVYYDWILASMRHMTCNPPEAIDK